MKHTKLLIGLIAVGALAPAGVPQQDVVLKITDGVPAISLALPDFAVRSGTPAVKEAAAEL